MIVDLLVQVLFGILNGLLELLPEYELPWQLETGCNTQGQCQWDASVQVAGMLSVWDLFFPVSLMLVCLGLVLGAHVVAAIVQFLRWVWDVLPFKSS